MGGGEREEAVVSQPPSKKGGKRERMCYSIFLTTSESQHTPWRSDSKPCHALLCLKPVGGRLQLFQRGSPGRSGERPTLSTVMEGTQKDMFDSPFGQASCP